MTEIISEVDLENVDRSKTSTGTKDHDRQARSEACVVLRAKAPNDHHPFNVNLYKHHIIFDAII